MFIFSITLYCVARTELYNWHNLHMLALVEREREEHLTDEWIIKVWIPTLWEWLKTNKTDEWKLFIKRKWSIRLNPWLRDTSDETYPSYILENMKRLLQYVWVMLHVKLIRLQYNQISLLHRKSLYFVF